MRRSGARRKPHRRTRPRSAALLRPRKHPAADRRRHRSVEKYYAGCVIGGPGAFFVEALSFKDFASAVRRKLILEISDLGPPAGGTPLLKKVAWMSPPSARPAVQVAAAEGYAPGCDIGERLYIKHKSGYGGDN